MTGVIRTIRLPSDDAGDRLPHADHRSAARGMRQNETRVK